MKPLELLVRAKAKIERPEHWTKGMYARTDTRDQCVPGSSRAEQWCAVGALHAMAVEMGESSFRSKELFLAERALENCLPKNALRDAVTTYNDSEQTTHADIMELYDCAIKAEAAL